MNLTVPNVLSMLRMALIPWFAISLLDGGHGRALIIFALAGVTDALDGMIARLGNQRSVLGMYLDPMADKLLLVCAYILLSIPSLNPVLAIPVWVTVLVITRDVIIVAVALILHLALKVNRFPPSLLSKLNTAAQLTAIVLVLGCNVVHRFETAALVSIYVVAGLTLASGVDYIFHANRLAAAERAESDGHAA